jgi:hypothetical protein
MFKTSLIPSARTVVNAIRRELRAELNKVGNALLEEARAATPIAPKNGGRARRGWTKTQSGERVSVSNRVPYIGKLENNYSKQTKGRGIVKPAIGATNRRRTR